jgi:hypothetical protein
MQNATSQDAPPSLRIRLTPPLIALTLLLVFVPGGCRDSWMKNHRTALVRKEAAIAQSPLHAKCSLCFKPATHSQLYMREGLGYTGTFYFCDDHWPAPEKAPYLAHGDRAEDIAPQLRGDEIASLIAGGFAVLSLGIFLICRQVRHRLKAFNLVTVTFAAVLVLWTMATFFGAGIGSGR